MQIMTDGDGDDHVGFVTGTALVDPTSYEVFKLLETLAEPLGLDGYTRTFLYTAEKDGHDRSLYTHRGVAIMVEKCWQECMYEWVKDSFTDQVILGPVAWAVELMDKAFGDEGHAVLGFFASREEAEERLRTVMEDDPEVTVKGRDAFDDSLVRKIRPYELRGKRAVRPKEVWACILSMSHVHNVVHAVYDSKEEAQRFWERTEGCKRPDPTSIWEQAQLFWERPEGSKLPDLSKGMVGAPDGEHGIEVRCFPF